MTATRSPFGCGALAAAATAVGLLVSGCGLGTVAIARQPSGPPSCPRVLARAHQAVKRAALVSPEWTGPRSGPTAAHHKLIVYVGQTLTNPGIVGSAAGLQSAGRALGWRVRVLDGQGTPSGVNSALSQAISLHPAGIVIGGFDPTTTKSFIEEADRSGIVVVGWHASPEPGPSRDPTLFANVTTSLREVAGISADWIIGHSDGKAGVVVWTDDSVAFASLKAKEIVSALKTCSGVKVLDVADIPLSDAAVDTPPKYIALIEKWGNRWTYSDAINDLYFDNAANPLRSAGFPATGPPYNVGDGDGSVAAFERIHDREFQSVTVPEPLSEEGWQIADEFNRAFHHDHWSGYVPPVHITDAGNVGTTTAWNPKNGYQEHYRKIWGIS